jgi:hypothetical protein
MKEFNPFVECYPFLLWVPTVFNMSTQTVLVLNVLCQTFLCCSKSLIHKVLIKKEFHLNWFTFRRVPRSVTEQERTKHAVRFSSLKNMQPGNFYEDMQRH